MAERSDQLFQPQDYPLLQLFVRSPHFFAYSAKFYDENIGPKHIQPFQ
jgi:hypothetical protein